MVRIIPVLVAVLVTSCFACGAEVRYGTTAYHLRDVTYFSPHTYDFSLRQQSLGVADRVSDYLLARLSARRK